MRSHGRYYAFRLKPRQDLKKSLLQFADDNNIAAGTVVSCVGSLEKTNLRFANQKDGVAESGYFEITSLVGTFSRSSAHLHLSIADGEGKMQGGHLLEGNLIYTTAELVVVDLIDLRFEREVDPAYNYAELTIVHRAIEWGEA
jgi:uncharacterized protein